MIKIFMKEDWIPPFANKVLFVIAPAIVMITVLMSFTVLPITPAIQVTNLNIGLLFFLAMSSLGVYSVVLGGWASNSKYALVGGVHHIPCCPIDRGLGVVFHSHSVGAVGKIGHECPLVVGVEGVAGRTRGYGYGSDGLQVGALVLDLPGDGLGFLRG
jgi:hypothetical protein